MKSFVCILFSLLALSAGVHSHGSADPNADWATRHMQGKQSDSQKEHHIGNFDPSSFFYLHDYDNSGAWTTDEVRRTYGMDDSSNSGVSEDRKQQALREIFAVFDPWRTGSITRDEFVQLSLSGKKLPDVGLGPGHHGDIEYEYEIHHFEKFHGDDATEEELNHPEDIEHFRLHDQLEDAQIALQAMEGLAVVDKNIPAKFLRK
ncbi:EF hand domain containing protein [Ascosphaera apis ARSEF 7405]|uniref:EF hand domain containing protein n=1 Tax=Ascosphaera apis ARSEF 7405 TaxID=392613 RepID=A0A167X1S1_9EURO|nr:EF hand domain containing protein [Ascosphaera apis ARSEF 7405]